MYKCTKDRCQTEKRIHLLRVGWRNFFSSCAVVSVFCSGGKKVLVLHTTYVLRVPYSCGVVLVFWFWWEIVFGVMYIHSVQYSCAVVFLENDYSVSLFLEKQLASQNIFLVKSEHSITKYLFLVFYKSTSL